MIIFLSFPVIICLYVSILQTILFKQIFVCVFMYKNNSLLIENYKYERINLYKGPSFHGCQGCACVTKIPPATKLISFWRQYILNHSVVHLSEKNALFPKWLLYSGSIIQDKNNVIRHGVTKAKSHKKGSS